MSLQTKREVFFHWHGGLGHCVYLTKPATAFVEMVGIVFPNDSLRAHLGDVRGSLVKGS